MDVDKFAELLSALPESDWQAVRDGRALVLVDDDYLQLGPFQAPGAIIHAGDSGDAGAETAAELRQACLAQAAEILHNYYKLQPLTQAGFIRQVETLLSIHGMAKFAALNGELPVLTLFVEGGEVLALGSDNPRHRYGTYCDAEQGFLAGSVEDRVRHWLDSGEAYRSYLGMNVCRYNC